MSRNGSHCLHQHVGAGALHIVDAQMEKALIAIGRPQRERPFGGDWRSGGLGKQFEDITGIDAVVIGKGNESGPAEPFYDLLLFEAISFKRLQRRCPPNILVVERLSMVGFIVRLQAPDAGREIGHLLHVAGDEAHRLFRAAGMGMQRHASRQFRRQWAPPGFVNV